VRTLGRLTSGPGNLLGDCVCPSCFPGLWHSERPPRPQYGLSSRPSCSREVSLTLGTPSSGQKPHCPCQGMCQSQSSTRCFGNLQRMNPRKTACSWLSVTSLADGWPAPGGPGAPAGGQLRAGPSHQASASTYF
jgi:hypothetical protein